MLGADEAALLKLLPKPLKASPRCCRADAGVVLAPADAVGRIGACAAPGSAGSVDCSGAVSAVIFAVCAVSSARTRATTVSPRER
ncbi:hypothetical protein [Rhodococcus sp. MTM3W5.2]|uniref:hypothetical protein n=1 Tax=Rhodococcus sp. MTM3W5.2 TaxID=1805827 RepID=UPI0009FAE2FD|nr:hypothetical protein [Rhodococcus sp. MTM3W5.2]